MKLVASALFKLRPSDLAATNAGYSYFTYPLDCEFGY